MEPEKWKTMKDMLMEDMQEFQVEKQRSFYLIRYVEVCYQYVLITFIVDHFQNFLEYYRCRRATH